MIELSLNFLDLQTTLTVVRCLIFGSEALLSSLKLVFIFLVHVNREAFTGSVRVQWSKSCTFLCPVI